MKLIARVSIFIALFFSFLIVNNASAVNAPTSSKIIWDKLVAAGFTEKQAAAMLGSMWDESRMNPLAHEGAAGRNTCYNGTTITLDTCWNSSCQVISCKASGRVAYGIGLIQWSYGRRVNFYKYYKENASATYISMLADVSNKAVYFKNYSYNGDYVLNNGIISESDFRAIVQIEVDYLWKEMNQYYSGKKFMTEASTASVYDLGKYFAQEIEVCSSCWSSTERPQWAEEYYSAFAGTAAGEDPTGGSTTPGAQGTTQDPATTKWFAKNNIVFYQRYDCIPKTATTSGEEAPSSILSSSELSTINSRKSLYQTAVEGTSVPWELLAAYVYWNEHWSYEDTHSWTSSDATNPTVLKSSAELINQYLEGTDDNSIKHSIFMYFINDVYGNPTSLSFYTVQATNLGFTEIQASNGDGCPFVVNRIDPQRDPSSESFAGADKWKYSSNDFSGTPPTPGTEYGVFVIYTAIKNAPTTGSESSDDQCVRPTGGTQTQAQSGEMEKVTITSSGTATSGRDIKGDWYTVKPANAPGYNMVTFSDWMMENGLKQPYEGAGSSQCDLYASAIQKAIFVTGLSAKLEYGKTTSNPNTLKTTDQSELLTYFYTELQKNRPIQTIVSRSATAAKRNDPAFEDGRHFVTVVGFKTSADPNNLKPSDFLIQNNYELAHIADDKNSGGRILWLDKGTYWGIPPD